MRRNRKLFPPSELALVEVIRRSHRSLQFSGRGILSGTPCIATYSSCQSRSGKHSRRTGMRQALLQCCGSSRKLSRGTAAHKLCNSVNCRCGHCRSGYSLWMQLPSQAQCGAQQEYQSILGDRLESIADNPKKDQNQRHSEKDKHRVCTCLNDSRPLNFPLSVTSYFVIGMAIITQAGSIV